MHQNPYSKAIGWFVCSLLIGCVNDALTKYLGDSLPTWQVAFGRFFCSSVTLLPYMLYSGKEAFKTHRPALHLLRGILLVIAISLWTHGIKTTPITTATLMSFTIPIFVLLLARIWLKEPVTGAMWVATLLGFVGIGCILQPTAWEFSAASCCFLFAAFLFGFLDVLNKKYVTQEPLLCMLFYSTLTATVLMALPAVHVWSKPTAEALVWLFMLGIGSNLILYCLLKAFSLVDAASLAPFRYLELLLSMGISYTCFHELPSLTSCLGACIIIPCTLFVGYQQSHHTD